ncbi:class I SAM-dependent methyltransferase [Prauserella muralis]|uniref:Uncharacterized protein n=1 Tax=Prauserella muralis TaxID=588067 RepID=A0A2V4AHS1_9PSEU|nr:methyltransferase domain-containing protein [Prauserella muralis]PXY19465.1 hypothetical protein BAY60_32515 [Prauserella muralis]TWE29442.1 methyltransferase family protein [Prauserella muralis]
MDGAGLTRPEAITRALPLLDSVPDPLDTRHGYLDLLGEVEREPPGAVQSLWESTVGSALYDPVQSLGRRVFTALRPPVSRLAIPPGGRVLDAGCGPGDVTAELGSAAGPDGLALGVDVSDSMLARAVRAHAEPNVGFVRADVRRLPFADATFDAVSCLAVLQLVPEPFRVLGELVRVLVPGGRLAILVPAPAGPLSRRLSRLIPNAAGLTLLSAEELAESLHAHGVTTVHTRQNGPVLSVLASGSA